MQIIQVVGLASHKIQSFTLDENQKNQNLLSWLTSQGIPMASSCSGKGVCKKCVIQQEILSCELTIEEFFKQFPDGKIFVGYL